LEDDNVLMVATTEDACEQHVGAIQAFIRERGTHWNEDIEREFKSSVLSAEADAQFKLATLSRRSRSGPLQREEGSDERGLLLCPTLLEADKIKDQWAAIRDAFSAKPYASLLREAHGVVFVTPADTNLQDPLSELAKKHVVLCFCRESENPCSLHADST
jgi:hypothetical protein